MEEEAGNAVGVAVAGVAGVAGVGVAGVGVGLGESGGTGADFWVEVAEAMGWMTVTAELEAVMRGDQWLVDHGRPRWWEEVDWDRFNFWNGERCVVGQIYGNPWQRKRVQEYVLPGSTFHELCAWSRRHGFVGNAHGYSGEPVTRAEVLARLWPVVGMYRSAATI